MSNVSDREFRFGWWSAGAGRWFTQNDKWGPDDRPEFAPDTAMYNYGAEWKIKRLKELLRPFQCPYWLKRDGDTDPPKGDNGPGTCRGGCHDEPNCITGSWEFGISPGYYECEEDEEDCEQEWP